MSKINQIKYQSIWFVFYLATLLVNSVISLLQRKKFA